MVEEDAQPQFSIDWLIEKPSQKERATQVVCAAVLGAERYGKLIHQFELERILTSGLSVSVEHKDLCSIFSICGTPIAHSIDKTIEMLISALNEVVQTGVHPDILSQTKRNMRYQWTIMKTDPQVYSEELLMWHLFDSTVPHSHQLELLESVTATDIYRFLSAVIEQAPVICKGQSVRAHQ